MSYNPGNKHKMEAYVRRIYEQVKEHDIPDTHIVRHILPKHGVFISYRRFMEIKHGPLAKPVISAPHQTVLF